MTIFVTADTHFNHDNIRKYCDRPFDSVEEMNRRMIENWNNRVQSGDDVYHLGDFGWGSHASLHNILDQLNGRIYFIRGNHDKSIKKALADRFVWVKDYHELTTHGYPKICMFHYPLRTWRSKHHGSYCLHGHSHGKLPAPPGELTVDVGVDVWNYSPVSLEEIKEHMEKVKNS
jgi:calcineurin-like phosphoesterase family protein